MPTENLYKFFKENPRFAIAFSGGCDSSYLLYTALNAGADVKPYFVKTEFQPEFELKDALEFKSELTVIYGSTLSHPEVVRNDSQRCYFCKRYILSLIKQRAKEDGYTVICDGSNASDETSDRPGMKALEEYGVRSPLREAGLTKSEIRRLSKEARLVTWDKPSYSCLATRIPKGSEITADALNKVEKGEMFLFSLGFKNFRLRYINSADIDYRLELPSYQTEMAKQHMQAISEKLGKVVLAERNA